LKRRIAISAISSVLVLVTASASLARPRHTAPGKCPPAHAHLIVADSQAQVYVRPESTGLSGPFENEEIYGCAYGRRRAYGLGLPYVATSTGANGVRMETLAGPIAAYEAASASGAQGQAKTISWRVVVRDLRSGRVLHDVPTGTPKANPFAVGVGRTLAIVVKSDGAVAWIAQAPPYEGTYQVHALDKSGSRLLASGAEVDPSSLAIGGSTLYWTQGGKPMSAPLN
jgi:hypothetical protein